MLVAVGVGTAVAADFETVALANGLVIAALLTSTGHVSAEHFNPAIPLSMVAPRLKGSVEGSWYVLAQLAGAWFGMAEVAQGTGAPKARLVATAHGFAWLSSRLDSQSRRAVLLLDPANGPALATTRWIGPALSAGTRSANAAWCSSRHRIHSARSIS